MKRAKDSGLFSQFLNGLTTWAAYAWVIEKARRALRDLRGEAGRKIDEFRGGFSPEYWKGEFSERLQSVRRKAREVTPEMLKAKLNSATEGEKMQSKRWSFFKVILIIGIIIAVAIFLLDRILPRPYREEDLGDIWAEEDDDFEDEEDEAVIERPVPAEASSSLQGDEAAEEDPGVSGNGSGEQKKKKSTRKSSPKKDKSDE